MRFSVLLSCTRVGPLLLSGLAAKITRLQRNILPIDVCGCVAGTTAALVAFLLFIDCLARVDARLRQFNEANSPWEALNLSLAHVNLYLFIFQFFKRLLDNLIVFLQSLHFWVHFSDVLFQTIRQLHLENRAACNVVCHTLQRLLHAVQDIILKLELLSVLLVLFLEAWVVLLVRLEFWLLKDSSPHLITLPERHRDVIRILIRVLIVAVSAFALALRIRCHIQVTDPSTQHLTLIFVRSIGTSVFGVHMRQFLIAITAAATVLL